MLKLISLIVAIAMAHTPPPPREPEEVLSEALNLNQIWRISLLGQYPARETIDYVANHAKSLAVEVYPFQNEPSRQQDLFVFTHRMLQSLHIYKEKVESLESGRTFGADQVRPVIDAGIEARRSIMIAAAQTFHDGHDFKWDEEYAVVRAFIETQSTHFLLDPQLADRMRQQLSQWPTLFEHVFDSLSPKVQTYIIDEVLNPEFTPPRQLFGVAAREILARRLREGSINPTLAVLGRQELLNAQINLYADSASVFSGLPKIEELTQTERAFWRTEMRRQLPIEMDAYLKTEFTKLSQMIDHIRPMTQFKGGPEINSNQPKVGFSVLRALHLQRNQLNERIGAGFYHSLYMLVRLLRGDAEPGFESLRPLIERLSSVYLASDTHPLLTEFSIKLLYDILKNARFLAPITPDDSEQLNGLFVQASHQSILHPRVAQLAHLVLASRDFNWSTKLVAVNYLLRFESTQELETEKAHILKRAPTVQVSRNGERWRVGDQISRGSLHVPYLEVWMHQQGAGYFADCQSLLER